MIHPADPGGRTRSGGTSLSFSAAVERPLFSFCHFERIADVHRIGEPVEVSGAVVFLASPAASLITGRVAQNTDRVPHSPFLRVRVLN